MGPPGSDGGLISAVVFVAAYGFPFYFSLSLFLSVLGSFFISSRLILIISIISSVPLVLLLLFSTLTISVTEGLDFGPFQLGVALSIIWLLAGLLGVSLGLILGKGILLLLQRVRLVPVK